MDFLSNLVYVHWKSAFWVRPWLKTSLWRHSLTDFHDFGINGKRKPYPIPWYQTIILWARQFQVHKGGGNHPLGKPCYKKRLGRTRVNIRRQWNTSYQNKWVPRCHLRALFQVDETEWTNSFRQWTVKVKTWIIFYYINLTPDLIETWIGYLKGIYATVFVDILGLRLRSFDASQQA